MTAILCEKLFQPRIRRGSTLNPSWNNVKWILFENYSVYICCTCNGRISRCCHIESSFTGPPCLLHTWSIVQERLWGLSCYRDFVYILIIPAPSSAFKLGLVCNQSTVTSMAIMILNMPILRGNCTPKHTWACFVLYTKIINTVENNISIQNKIVRDAQKWH